MLPPQERLDRDGPAVLQVDDGLVGQPELAPVERPAQVVLRSQAVEGVGPHDLVEELVRASTATRTIAVPFAPRSCGSVTQTMARRPAVAYIHASERATIRR